MDRFEAAKWCEDQGGRLATSEELKDALEANKESFGKHASYWSSYHYGNMSAWFGWKDGQVKADYAVKTKKHHVRCVLLG
jgi:hypothetical protein